MKTKVICFYFNIFAATSSENRKKVFLLFGNISNYISFINPRNTADITNFEIDITVKSTFSTQFYCLAYNGSREIYSFNKITVTVSEIPPPPPPPTLSSSVSTVHLNRTFILTCSLQSDTFQFAPNRSYSVAFYNGHEGELAKYDVDGKRFAVN